MRRARISFIISCLAAAGLLSGAASQARAEEEAAKAWSVDLATAVNSDYMFRGFNLYDGISIQPTATVSYDTGYGTLSGNLWMHLSAEGDRQEEKFTELDETVSYSIDFDAVNLKGGFLWYTYPDDSDDIVDTAEVFAGIGLDDSSWNPFALNPTFTVWEDYREFDTWYYELGFSHEIKTEALGKDFATTPYVTFGFASSSENVYDKNGLEQISIGTSFALKCGDLDVTPTLNYSFKIDDNTVNEFWAGVTFGYSI